MIMIDYMEADDLVHWIEVRSSDLSSHLKYIYIYISKGFHRQIIEHHHDQCTTSSFLCKKSFKYF